MAGCTKSCFRLCTSSHSICRRSHNIAGNVDYCLVHPCSILWTPRDFHLTTSTHPPSPCLYLRSRSKRCLFFSFRNGCTRWWPLRWRRQGDRLHSCKTLPHRPNSISAAPFYSKGSNGRHSSPSFPGKLKSTCCHCHLSQNLLEIIHKIISKQAQPFISQKFLVINNWNVAIQIVVITT